MGSFSSDAIKYAQETQEKYGVPASVTLAQYAIESGYGTSTLATKYNNYFGITGSNNGKTVVMSGRNWRTYSNMEESFNDHGKLLASSLYANKTKGAKTISEYVNAFAETYAPASDGNNNYAGTVLQIISDNNLTQYDNGNYSAAGIQSSAAVQNLMNTNSGASMGGDIMTKVVRVTIIIVLVILAFIFFMTAFDIPISKVRRGGKKSEGETID